MLLDCVGNQREFYFFYIATCLFIVLEEAFESIDVYKFKEFLLILYEL